MNTQPALIASSLSAALTLAMLSPAAMAQTTPAAGNIASGTHTITSSRTTAAAYPNERRMFALHPSGTPVAPRRSYVTSCLSGTTRKIFASFTSRSSTGVEAGTIISATVNNSTGVVSGFSQKDFTSECLDMAGITASASCNVVAALCKRPANAAVGTADKDLVAAIPTTTWGNKFRDALTADPNDNRMWLYEWVGASGAMANPTGTAPTRRFVVAKNIRSTATWPAANGPFVETGHHSLVFSPAVAAANGLPASPSFFAISMKTTTRTGTDGIKHDGDKFVVVNRSTAAIDLDRGWIDSCGTGHPRTNRIAMRTYNASGDIYQVKFGVLCTTDWNGVANVSKAGIWMRTEGGAVGQPLAAGKLATVIYNNTTVGTPTNYPNGGGGPLVATPTGYLGVVVGSGTTTGSVIRSQIGLVTFDKSGFATGTHWLKTSTSNYLGYPQLVEIGKEADGVTPRFLLGWADMMAAPSTMTTAQVAAVFNTVTGEQKPKWVATRYYVQEISATGAGKTTVKQITDGWGEQDQMVSMGRGKVAWVYRPNPALTFTNGVPSAPTAYSTQLRFVTYTSTNLTPVGN